MLPKFVTELGFDAAANHISTMWRHCYAESKQMPREYTSPTIQTTSCLGSSVKYDNTILLFHKHNTELYQYNLIHLA